MLKRMILGFFILGLAMMAAMPEWSGEAGQAFAAKKEPPPVVFTATEQAVVDEVLKAQPEANILPMRNKFCPVTGKLADPDVAPVAVNTKNKNYSLVAVAEAGLIEKYAESHTDKQVKAFSKLLPAAANVHMMVHEEGTGDDIVLSYKRIELPEAQRAPVPEPKNISVELAVDASKKFQTMDGFGTATYAYSRANHEVYAKPEFQKLIAEDLGMSMVRFPMVPAFFDAVENPEDITRKKFQFEGNLENPPINARGLQTARPTKGVIPCLEFIAALVKINPEIRVIGSVWSPPHWMKTNNRQAGGSMKPEYYRHFAKYLVEWVLYVKEQYGIDMYALSPQNELAFFQPYDSCFYKPNEFAELMAIIGEEFEKAELDVLVFGPEDMTKIPDRTMTYVNAMMNNPAAARRLDIIATHGYSDGIESTGSVDESSVFWNAIKDFGKPHWMTETGPQAPDDRWNDGGPDGMTRNIDKKGRDLGLLDGALSSVGGRLHYAMVYGNTSAWVFWQITGDRPSVHSLMTEGKADNRYYVAKHFWRWIRPGAVRIAAGPDGGEEGVCVSAYQHAEDGTVTVVLLNRSNDNAAVSLDLKTDVAVGSFETWRSSETEQHVALPATAVQGCKAQIQMPPRSMVTLYGAAK